VRVHIIPRLGRIPIQHLGRGYIRALYEELRASGRVPKLTAEHRQVLEDVALRYRAAAEAGARSPVRVLIEQLGVPEATVRHWVRRCRELGLLADGQRSARETGRRGLSPKSVWNVHICLRAALNDAIEDGLIRTNPAKGLMKEPSGHQEMKTWTVEELREFLHFVRDDRNFALYRLAAYSGMRRGELLRLRWEDVKLHLGSLSVQQQLALDDDSEDGCHPTLRASQDRRRPALDQAGRHHARHPQTASGDTGVRAPGLGRRLPRSRPGLLPPRRRGP